MTDKLFGVLVANPKQQPEVEKHCFGDCGKLSIAGAILSAYGPMMVCCEQTCPHMGAETQEPFGMTERGDTIYLRALRTGTLQ